MGPEALAQVLRHPVGRLPKEMHPDVFVGLRLSCAALPLLDGATVHARTGGAPGGTGRNRAACACRVRGVDAVDPRWAELLHDPQTSGGLLVALAHESVPGYLASLDHGGRLGAMVGEVISGQGITVDA